MDDKAFMSIIRRALLMIVRAIEKKYGLGNQVVEVGESDNLTQPM